MDEDIRTEEAARAFLSGSSGPEPDGPEESVGDVGEDGDVGFDPGDRFVGYGGVDVDDQGNDLPRDAEGRVISWAEKRALDARQQSGLYGGTFDVKDNFAEYAIARSIEKHNLKVQAAASGPDGASAGQYVTVRQGRELRRQIENILIGKFGPDGKKSLDMSRPVLGQVDQDELLGAMAMVFAVPMKGDPTWYVPATMGPERATAANKRKAEMEALRKDYIAVTGGKAFGEGRPPVFDPATGDINVDPSDPALSLAGTAVPLSPYSPAFADYATFRENGGRILYAEGVELTPAERASSGANLVFDNDGSSNLYSALGFLSVDEDGIVRQIDTGKGMDVLARVNAYRMGGLEMLDLWAESDGAAVPVADREMRYAGTVCGQTDQAGLSLLKDYMTAREFRDAEEWIRAYDDDGEPGRVSPKMASMALAVCEELRNRGFEFSIERDRKPGQLKAKLRGSKREVRLTDLSDIGGYYVGRVYEGGNFLYSRAPMKNSDGTYREEPYFDEQTAVTSMLFGLGIPTARIGWDLYKDKGGLYSRIMNTGGTDGDKFTYVGEIGHSYGRNGLQRRSTYWTVNPKTGGGRLSAWAGVSTRRNGKGTDLYLYTENERQVEHVTFEDDAAGTADPKSAKQKAAEFLQASVQSAKTNFGRLLQVDELIDLARDAQPGDEAPVLSNNPAVAAIQNEYWAYLTDPESSLRVPGPDDEALAMMTEAVEEMSEDFDPDADAGETAQAAEASSSEYDLADFDGDRERVVRQHLADLLDYKFGGTDGGMDGPVDLDADDPSWKGFCPSLVAVYMRSGYGPPRNKEDLISAMRELDFSGEEFQKDFRGHTVKYDDFDTLAVKDRLLKFHPETARSLTGENVEVSPFMATVRDAVVSSLRRNGCLIDDKDPDSVRIDENGVIHYKAYMMFGSTPSPNEQQMHKDANEGRRGLSVSADYSDVRTDWIKGAYTIPVEGELGQIFEPDADGVVETRYYGSKNKLMSPGYEAYVVMPKTGAATRESLPSRYRAKNMLAVLTENIGSQIRVDLQNGANFPKGLGELSPEDERRFLNAETEEERRALMAEFNLDDPAHNSFATANSRELREAYIKTYRNGQYQWSVQMENYLKDNAAGVSAGTTTSLNYTYRRGVYAATYNLLVEPEPGESLKDAFVRQQTRMLRYPEEALRKMFRTNRDAVHFPKYLLEGSSVMEEYQHKKAEQDVGRSGDVSVHDLTNDNQITPYMLTGGANMAIQMENSHVVLLEDKRLPGELVLEKGTVLTEPIGVADRTLAAGTATDEPVQSGRGGVLRAGSVIGSFLRLRETVMPAREALPDDRILPAGFTVPTGTVLGGDTVLNGVEYHAGDVLSAAVTTDAAGARLPAGTVPPSELKIPGVSIGRSTPLKEDIAIQPGMVIPAGSTLAGDLSGCIRMLPKGVPLPEDVTLPAGTVLPQGFRMRLFDAAYTGSGKNQGGLRYLVHGAGLTGVAVVAGPDDARMLAGEVSGPNDAMAGGAMFQGTMDDDASCELIHDNPDMKYIRHQPADRIQMTLANYHTGLSVAGSLFEPAEDSDVPEKDDEGKDYSHGVQIAQVTAGGYTFDDGCVYSDAFARHFQVIGEDGELRDICPGDKGCDLSGNKHTYAIRYDPDMPAEERERRGLTEVFKLFEMNPDLGLVMSPYSALTRFSAATAKLGMEEGRDEAYKPKDLVLPEGSTAGEPELDDDGNPTGRRVVKGGVVTVPIIITKQTADEHVSGYGEEDVKQGKGRKVSAQMSWVLSSAGAKEMMRAIYGPDAKSFMDTREYFIALGYDIGPTGQVMETYTPHNAKEERFVFDGPDAGLVGMNETGHKLRETCRRLFGEQMDQRGGFMKVPFPLKFAGQAVVDYDKKKQPVFADKYLNPSGDGMYLMPVLSAHLRSGQEWQDGERKSHEYTNWYTQIYAYGVEYMREKDRAGFPEGSTEENDAMKEIRRNAQRAFDSISNDIVDRRIDTKYGFARGSMMTRRMPHSATAIWTADPTLDVDEIAVSADLLHVLGLKLKLADDGHGNKVPALDERGRMMVEGDENAQHLLTTRDPVLDRGGVRSLRVVPVAGAKGYPDPSDKDKVIEGTVGKPGDQVRGVKVNPLIAATFKGDFDGDSVGLVALDDKKAKEEQRRLFSVEQNILDMTKVRENGDYQLILNVTMDVISSEYVDPSLKERRLNMEHAANLIARGIPVERVATVGSDGVTRIFWDEDKGRAGQVLDDQERMALNKKLCGDISDYARDALHRSVGTEAISFNSLDEHMNSLKVPVQHGAKGKLANLGTYGKYYGIEAESMTAGMADMEGRFEGLKTRADGRPDVTDKDIRDVECATAYKAYGTGNAGSVQQLVVAFARNAVLATERRMTHDEQGNRTKMSREDVVAAQLSVLDAALYITQGATQGLLQAKHDPIKAQKFYAMINGPIPAIFKGYKMEFIGTAWDENKQVTDGYWSTVQATDDNGMPLPWPERATAEEWAETARMIFKDSVRGLGMDDLNDRHFDVLGQAAVNAKGKVIDMNKPGSLLELGASPMDILAYTCPKKKATVQFIGEMAMQHMNIFSGGGSSGRHSGGVSSWFMPNKVRENEKAMDEGRTGDVKVLAPGDVRVFKQRGEAGQEKEAVKQDAKQVAYEKQAGAPETELAPEVKARMADLGRSAAELQAEYDEQAAKAGQEKPKAMSEQAKLLAARRFIIEQSGLRDDLLEDRLGIAKQEHVPGSAAARQARKEAMVLDKEIKGVDWFPNDRDMNLREEATVRWAEQALIDYAIDKGRMDWVSSDGKTWDMGLVTMRAKVPVELTREETMAAAALLSGLRKDLSAPELRYDDDPSRRLAGEGSADEAAREAAMLAVKDKLQQLYDLGYQQYMTVEADASYVDRCQGTKYEPRHEVAELSYTSELREASKSVAVENDVDRELIEKLNASIPVVRDFYQDFEDACSKYGGQASVDAEDATVLRGQMQDAVVGMAERLEVLYKNWYRDELPDPEVVEYGEGELPECEEGMGAAVSATCEDLAAAVRELYAATDWDSDQRALDDNQKELFSRIVKDIGNLNDFGFTHGCPVAEEDRYDYVEPEKAEEREKPVEKTAEQAEPVEPPVEASAEEEKPAAKPSDGSRGKQAAETFRNVEDPNGGHGGADDTKTVPGE